MRKQTRQDLANTALDRWCLQYGIPKSDIVGSTKHESIVALQLSKLGPNPDEVDKIIGNKTWTNHVCCECKATPAEWITFKVFDGEFLVCLDCLKQAVILLESK